jgi:sigma-B regulation protein RsbU (phosphoserine phosphatase)
MMPSGHAAVGRLHWSSALLWLLSAWVLLGIGGAVTYLQVREVLLRQAGEALLGRHRQILEQLAGVITAAERGADAVAAQVLDSQLDAAQLVSLLKAQVLHDGTVVQVAVMLEPGNPFRAAERFGVSVTYGVQGLQITDFVATGYRYWEQAWYQRTLGQRERWWSEPYFNDAAGGIDTITFDRPLVSAVGRSIGMVGISLSLDRLDEQASENAAGSDGRQQYALVDRGGRVLLAWQSALERAHDLDSARQRRPAAMLEALAEADTAPAQRLQRVHDAGRGAQWLALGSLPALGWTLALAQDDRATLAELHQRLAWTLAPLALLLLGGAYAAGRRGALRIVRLQQLTAHAEDLLAAPSAPPLPLREASLQQRLDTLLDALGSALQQGREALQQAQGESARQQIHLQQLQALQARLLPSDQVYLSSVRRAQLAGWLKPGERPPLAQLYGFQSLGPGRCGFYLLRPEGDVQEALYSMLQLSVLLPQLLRDEPDPSRLLQRLAGFWQAQERPPSGARLLVGNLELDSGELALACAGLAAPVLRRQNDTPRALPSLDAALSAVSAAPVPLVTLRMQPGDLLLAGSQRAEDGQSMLLQVALERHADAAPGPLLAGLAEELGWSRGADEQAALLLRLLHRD